MSINNKSKGNLVDAYTPLLRQRSVSAPKNEEPQTVESIHTEKNNLGTIQGVFGMI